MQKPPKYARSPLSKAPQSLLQILLQNIALISVATRLLGLVSARLSCDEMAGAVCECVRVCVCFALKVQLKCVGFPAL